MRVQDRQGSGVTPQKQMLIIVLFAPLSVTHGAANVLIYSATKGFRHDSIPPAVQSLKSRSVDYNITFEDTENLAWFREDTGEVRCYCVPQHCWRK